jgi:hypothetical protein
LKRCSTSWLRRAMVGVCLNCIILQINYLLTQLYINATYVQYQKVIIIWSGCKNTFFLWSGLSVFREVNISWFLCDCDASSLIQLHTVNLQSDGMFDSKLRFSIKFCIWIQMYKLKNVIFWYLYGITSYV